MQLEAKETEKKWWQLSKKWKIILGSVFVIFAVMLPVTFLVIIPNVVQGIVDDTDMTVDQVFMLDPTNGTFTSSVHMTFSKAPPMHATMRLDKVSVSCDEISQYDYLQFSHSNTLTVDTDPVVLTSTATVTDEAGLEAFTKHAMESTSFTWHLKGSSTVNAIIPVETHVDKLIELTGFSDFTTANPNVTTLSVTGGTATSLFLQTKTFLNIESNIVMGFGQDMHMVLKSDGVVLGVATIPDCVMKRGNTEYPVSIEMSPSSDEERDTLNSVFGNYVSGVNTAVTLEGFFLDTPVEWLSPALSTIRMEAALPSISDLLITRIDMGPINLRHLVNVPFTLDLYDAIDVDITVTGMKARIFYENEHIADVDESGLSIHVPANSGAKSTELSARSDFKHAGVITDLLQAGEGLLDVESTVIILVQEFEVILPYNQKQVPAYII